MASTLVIAVLVAVAAPSRPEPRFATAIAVARGTSGILSPFPQRPGRTRCRTPRGGPTLVRIPGSCRTAVGRRGQAVVVSFVKTWNARAFHAQGAATRGTLAHTWRFFETRRARIRREVTFGDFPPQWVR